MHTSHDLLADIVDTSLASLFYSTRDAVFISERAEKDVYS